MTTTTQRLHTRWMVRRDVGEVLSIEAASFGPDAWGEAELLGALRARNCIGMVAEQPFRDGDGGWPPLAGHMVYELHKKHLHLLTFAVHPQHQRRGVGRQMVAKMVGKLSSHRRTRLVIDVPDHNLDAQLFFRSQGFRCTRILRDAGREAYRMVYKLPPFDGVIR